jgi:hypothetical protein
MAIKAGGATAGTVTDRARWAVDLLAVPHLIPKNIDIDCGVEHGSYNLEVVGGWVSYMRTITTRPERAVRAATA